ncbi:glycosyltransferase [Hyphomicrobium sp.]|uniref:glycosyltransferase n=1 Tax=Hyphomicrobium sp. TaxID=82 RepID=UPI000FA263F6|nr:glycosyltransferase [Hyphomicrobium sp.]RUO97523.1 MAG: glycosyltransferase [Hyphomicrobium sp.]
MNAAEARLGDLRRRVCLHLVGASTISGGGGSNTFIRGLARRQADLGWTPIVVLSQGRGQTVGNDDKSSENFEVRVLPEVRGVDRRAYYNRCPVEAPGVAELFSELCPRVVHFHTLNPAAGRLHLEAAKAVNARTVVTYHTGGISCPQTGLLENGRAPCDGRLSLERCTRCRFANRGIPRPVAEFLARHPSRMGSHADSSLFGRLVSSRAMTDEFIRSFHHAVSLIDVFHIQSRWIADVLRTNGVPASKLALVEMGVAQAAAVGRSDLPESFSKDRPLRLVFAGRCIDVKGIETILAAFRILPPAVPVEVSFLGSGWETAYGVKLLRQFDRDIRLQRPRVICNDDILEELGRHDVCIVPSIWLETGPLAVYEAMAAGVPVVGSCLGGIAERVRHNIDGLLFQPGNARELAQIIRALVACPDRLRQLQRNIKPQRTFDDMTQELDKIYLEGEPASCGSGSGC